VHTCIAEFSKRLHRQSRKSEQPRLGGFSPDPSACVVGKDIYLATSSIAWFPGVPSHHRRDLVHSWRSQQESGLDS
jgi:beta-xylosidase